ncbi:MAG: aminodeoxychorismate/anthranilate synthase component II [Alphaproteobacteria bacterium]|nr:aminodeoxychorismate/anthranilate synthase component II [Alphaproteobacteria bacterium]OJV15342.1 MAG: hypothetical protein BGO27_02415 [Alphaproteobacteria bacterium 33-17]
MIVLIDNFDSFTYNLVSFLKILNLDYKVIRYQSELDHAISLGIIDKIIISPGPSHPKNSLISLNAIRYAEDNNIPLLGVCLGHQAIGLYFGCDISKNPYPIHGKVHQIKVTKPDSILFQNVPKLFNATRYHSLCINSINNNNLEITSTTNDGIIMAIEHKHLPIYGVQFHPESITSEFGFEIVKNFIYN